MTDWKILDDSPALYVQLRGMGVDGSTAENCQADADAINRLYRLQWIAPLVCDRARGKLITKLYDALKAREKAEAAS